MKDSPLEKVATVPSTTYMPGLDLDVYKRPNGVGGYVYESYDGNPEGVTEHLLDTVITDRAALEWAVRDAFGDGWVSVEERLPESNELMHLIFCPGNLSAYAIASYEADIDVWVDVEDMGYGPTHWMPLPKPPEQ